MGWHWCAHRMVGHPGGDEYGGCRHARTAQHPPGGAWRIWVMLAGRGSGKALALETRLPTPTGWTTMGAVEVGDEVLDEGGRRCRVTYATEVQVGRSCYRVTFGDGTAIVADGEHRWRTWTHGARKAAGRRVQGGRGWPARRGGCEPAVRTTVEIAATLTQGVRGDRNHSVEVAAALDLPEAEVAIDPYVLGVWLGDGHSGGATVTTGDPEILDRILAAGYAVGTAYATRFPERGCRSYGIGARPEQRGADGRLRPNGSIASELRRLGVLGHKRIPAAYLRGSIAQRLALLQGLMDTDGWASGTCRRATLEITNGELAQGALELIRSLGMVPRMQVGRARLHGRDCGPLYRIGFRPTQPVFRLARKAARMERTPAQASRHRHRMITGVEPVASVPVRCITVDSPSHLYLAGEGMIPTHNTRAGAEWLMHGAMRKPGTTWAVVAMSRDDLQATCIEGESGLLRAGGIAREDPAYNRTALVLRLKNGSVIRGLSAERPERTRGPNLAGAWLDELAAWRYRQAWDDLLPALRRGEARMCVTTTPKPTPLIADLVRRAERGDGVVMTRGRTRDNLQNLSRAAVADLQRLWAGTRRGRQELEGEMLADTPGALWTQERLDATRVAWAA